MRIDRVKLIAEMARQEMSCIQLAEKAGLGRATITSTRSGKSCSPATVGKIAKALGVPVESILKKED